jgi:hypothetical protein
MPPHTPAPTVKQQLASAMADTEYSKVIEGYRIATETAQEQFGCLFYCTSLQIPLEHPEPAFQPIIQRQKVLSKSLELIGERLDDIHDSSHRYVRLIRELRSAERELLLGSTTRLREMVRKCKADLSELDNSVIAEGNRWMRELLDVCRDTWPETCKEFVGVF